MRRLYLGLAVGLMTIAQATPAERCSPVNVETDHTISGHRLSLTLRHGQREFAAGRDAAPPKLPVGSRVDVCFESSRAGFVSLWSHDADLNPPVRILPNEYIRAESDELGFAVQPGAPRCFSDLAAGKRLSLEVKKPLGQAELYLHFAESPEGQISPGDFPSVGNKAILPTSCDDDINDGRTNPDTPTLPYASTALQYEVVR